MLTLDQVKSKSAARLGGLHPVLLAAANVLIQRSYARGVPIVITQGMRTIAEQNALYAQGRTQKGSIVTNARGGSSYHNYGLAVDFALLLPDGRNVSWDMKRDGDGDKAADWQEVVQEAKKLGFEWGGDWTSFKDYSHLQMAFGLTIAQLKAGRRPAAQQVKDALSRINGGENKVNKDVEVTVTLNGVKLTAGVLDNGTTYAPVRALAEALGAKVTYDPDTKTVNVETA
ncbi:M15 family metallopeptidase [Paenibacillus sp. S150]|uniref:M15 family metallopeptidase n=1 Tax=Paenibacillus sp. S150 TaxID=2749826 RepID=UPI001C560DEE|nr:M15 family metallopeptidase [Paenibacillus sp. S150]MBW4080032.1 M15 family metallopeptidase [Paenibacillus sp. S150]